MFLRETGGGPSAERDALIKEAATKPHYNGGPHVPEGVTLATPMVSFVVPCYKFAHFLVECVGSILSQSYEDVEVIIIDDRSPDDTAAIARGILAAHQEREIFYIYNAENLGNIRTYNKGISIARGKYIWILSPDDRLRSRDIIRKYVRLMESNSELGYVFCAAHRVEGDKDVGLHQRSLYLAKNQILDGHQLVRDIVENNFELIAASVMIRKECYERITMFPPDMPHRGDSYVWCLIALKYKVGYFAEAMVDYRVHSDSMMSTLMRENIRRCVEDDIAVPWSVKTEAETKNLKHIVSHCRNSIISAYKNALVGTGARGYTYSLSLQDVEASLLKRELDPIVRSELRSALAKRLYWSGIAELCQGDISRARKAFCSSFDLDPKLRYRPPIGQLMKTRKLHKVVIAVCRKVVANLISSTRGALRSQ
jgi:glycosyltransferase involved in cell wall biosynthesis